MAVLHMKPANLRLIACKPLSTLPRGTLEKFENGVVTLETHQMFSVHTTPV